MIYLKAFTLAGVFCALGQIILDNTKLTPGHVTSLFTVVGAILSFFGIYDKLITWGGAGATVLISNFGHALYTSGLMGLEKYGLLGIFFTLLNKASAAIVSPIVFSAFLTFSAFACTKTS